MSLPIVDALLEVAMTAHALGCAGVEIEDAMQQASRAQRDERFRPLVDERRADLAQIYILSPGALFERAKQAGLHVGLDRIVESLARVEAVRELLGTPDYIAALGPHPIEVCS